MLKPKRVIMLALAVAVAGCATTSCPIDDTGGYERCEAARMKGE